MNKLTERSKFSLQYISNTETACWHIAESSFANQAIYMQMMTLGDLNRNPVTQSPNWHQILLTQSFMSQCLNQDTGLKNLGFLVENRGEKNIFENYLQHNLNMAL